MGTEVKYNPKTSDNQEDLIPEDGIKTEPSQYETSSNTEELQLKRLVESSVGKIANLWVNSQKSKTKKQRTFCHKEDFSVGTNTNTTLTEAQKESDAAEEGDASTNKPRPSSKSTSEGTVAVTEFTVAADLQNLDDKINSMMMVSENSLFNSKGLSIGKARICKVCGKEGQYAHIQSHIEAHHITGVSHVCNICGKTFRVRNSLRYHKRQHKAEDVNGEAYTEEDNTTEEKDAPKRS